MKPRSPARAGRAVCYTLNSKDTNIRHKARSENGNARRSILLASVITARFLEKHKMRVAAVLYDLMFTVLLCLFSFILDIPVLREAWTNVLGANLYHVLPRISLLITSESFNGISVIVFIAVSIAVQLGIVIAVIAVLAAVLIPTFSGVITKANESKALQEVKAAYTATLTEDLSDSNDSNNVVYNETVVVNHNGTFITVSTSGAATVGGTTATHTLTNGKLAKIS